MKNGNGTDPDNSRLEDLLDSIDEELELKDLSQVEEDRDTHFSSSGSERDTIFHLSDQIILAVNETWTKAFIRNVTADHPPAESIKAFNIVQQMKELGVTYGIIEQNIQKAMTLIEEHPEAEIEVVAAAGRDPVPGRPANIEDWIGDETHAIDSDVIHARKNEFLLRLVSSKPGVAGIQINGRDLPPPPVEDFSITPGENVEANEDGEYFARCEGKVIFENNRISVMEVDRDATFSIEISSDDMTATISIEPPMGRGAGLTMGPIRSVLSQHQVCAGIDDLELRRCLAWTNEKREPVENAVIAKGKPSSEGRDSAIEWLMAPHEERERYVVGEDGSIDFYNLKELSTVEEGTLLAAITPATRGADGFNVLGHLLEGKWGTQLAITPGENILKKAKGTQWFAGCSGHYSLEDNVLNVQPQVRVNGDVDFSTGNINFTGDVVITGNVLDGFKVSATGNITVGGLIEAAHVEAGKCVEVKNGIFGKEKGLVTAKEDVLSSFMQNAHVKANRDVIVSNQILNSRVYAGRIIQVKHGKGSMVGGLAMAGNSIIVRTIGSEYGTKTVVDVGSNFAAIQRMQLVSNKQKKLSAKLDLLNDLMEKEKKNGLTAASPPERKKLFMVAYQKREALENTLANLQAELDEIAGKIHQTENPEIRAQNAVMPDVLVRIWDCRLKIKVPHHNALITYDSQNGRIKISKPKLK